MKEAPFPVVLVRIMVIIVPVLVLLVVLVAVLVVTRPAGAFPGHRHRLAAGLPGGTLDDLVQFPAVQPHSTALRTEVDFHALTFGHLKRHTAHGTVHIRSPLIVFAAL